MATRSFADALATLDGDTLTAVLERRPDVRSEPVPANLDRLADRLAERSSVEVAVDSLDRDTVHVGTAIALLGSAASVRAAADLLSCDVAPVELAVSALVEQALAWMDGEIVRLPECLVDHWRLAVGGVGTLAKVAVPDLATMARALGIESPVVTKDRLRGRLTEALRDLDAVRASVAALSLLARQRLVQMRADRFGTSESHGWSLPGGLGAVEELVRSGLAVRLRQTGRVTREIAIALWLAEADRRPTGRPSLRPAEAPADATRSAAEAAATDLLRGVSALLDTAATQPIGGLKTGGVGVRARTRLSKQHGVPADLLALWLDLVYAAGLLGRTTSQYVPSGQYAAWRASDPAGQWAAVALAWLQLPHAPSHRDEHGTDVPPPQSMTSRAGYLRRSLLRAAADGASVDGAVEQLDWFAPSSGYGAHGFAELTRAAVREAEWIGVVANDRLTDLGGRLLRAGDPARLAEACADLLRPLPWTMILQSDLTATVAGQAPATVEATLRAAAVVETRGGASVWRFTPASVRSAYDAGWTAESLLDSLRTASARTDLPQPLEYLVHDVARRHGEVRVQSAMSCLVADETLVIELMATRSLQRLMLRRIAPTVVACLLPPVDLLDALRAAGHAPVQVEHDGTIRVTTPAAHRGLVQRRPAYLADTPVVPSVTLAAQLLASPRSTPPPRQPRSGTQIAAGTPIRRPMTTTADHIRRQNPDLSEHEVSVLADAIDDQAPVRIDYRDIAGRRTTRLIEPTLLAGGLLEAWCHLRHDDRQFILSSIRAVTPTE